MKKVFFATALATVIISACTSCGSISNDDLLVAKPQDKEHAFVEITTSTRQSGIAASFHGQNSHTEKERQVYAIQNPTRLYLRDGETATLHFHCDQCGHDEVLEDVVAPASKLFSCHCSFDNPESLREYIGILVGDNADGRELVVEE